MTLYSFEHAKSYAARIIDVNERKGIPAEHREVIYDAMRGLETEERLVVTLFFMADLPVEAHTYDNIEANLRQIFPPIGLKNLKPENFRKFRETCITSVLKANPDLFTSPKRGRWMNTEQANKQAIQILKGQHVRMNLPKSV